MHRTSRPWPSLVALLLALSASVVPALSGGETANIAHAQTTAASWPMAGANPQRTSWTPEEVTGANLVAEWYRPIEAYISQNVQIIASDGLVFVATSRGLYAFNAATGDVAWRYDTELPLGHSPTVADGVVYFGGYDRKIHALNVQTGAQLWEFAGAGGGFSTSPLVVEGKVIAGNRDGYMYALGAHGAAQQGQVVWRYAVGAPIHQSAAYKDGILYFAGGDNRAYALRASNGALVWRSATLPGEQYQSYWPVIYRDQVVFSGALAYRSGLEPGTRSAALPGLPPDDSYHKVQIHDLWPGVQNQYAEIGPVVASPGAWAHGRTVLDASRVSEYLENNPDGHVNWHKPWRRTYIVLRQTDGTEYTTDVDGDGFREYAPIAYFGSHIRQRLSAAGTGDRRRDLPGCSDRRGCR